MTLRFLRPMLFLSAAIAAALLLSPRAFTRETRAGKPLKALLITGGCCHDYTNQKKILSEGVSARANVEWKIVQEGGTSTKHKVSIYEDPNWADGYDVIVHNECFAEVSDPVFIAKVYNAHKNGKPAVVVHCTMHTFRDLKTEDWHEFLGVSTNHHGRQHPLDVKTLKADHPIMKGFPSQWVTGNEELYQIDKVLPNTTVLAEAKAEDGNKRENALIWINTFGKGKVFGTTLAHNNSTMSDPVFLDMFTRGLLWATDKLDEDGKAKEGYGPSKAE